MVDIFMYRASRVVQIAVAVVDIFHPVQSFSSCPERWQWLISSCTELLELSRAVAVVDIILYRASRVVQIAWQWLISSCTELLELSKAVAVVDIILYRASRVVQSGGSG